VQCLRTRRGGNYMIVCGPHVVEWVAKQTNEYGNFGTDAGIGWKRDGELVAGVAYAAWNGVNVECHIAAKGKNWATRQYLGVIFDYPFNKLNCRRITVCVGEGNKSSRRFVEHLGFTREANLTGAHPTGDLLIYKMDRLNCRFLKEPYAIIRPDLLRTAA